MKLKEFIYRRFRRDDFGDTKEDEFFLDGLNTSLNDKYFFFIEILKGEITFFTFFISIATNMIFASNVMIMNIQHLAY